MSAPAVAPEAASAILSAALAAVGVPAPVAAVVVAVAPKLLQVLLELLEKHQAGAPLPAIERAALTDDSALVQQAIEAELAKGAP